MKLNRFADYGLRALIYLATHPGRRVTTEELAAAYGISRAHLQKIVRELGDCGFVELHRGRDGGLELARDPDSISIGAVLRKLDAETKLVECFDDETNACVISPACVLKSLLGRAEEAFFAELDDVMLAEVLRGRRKSNLLKLLGG